MNNINSAFLETKANNRLNALRLLFANESLSRTEIASFLGISTAAVTSIVNEFLESGLIIQCEESVDSPNKKAGRKQSPLKINYNWKYIVCFDIHPASVNIAITNLHGKLIVEEPFTFSSNWNKKEFCSELAKECYQDFVESFYPFESDPGCRCFCDRTGKPPGGNCPSPLSCF